MCAPMIDEVGEVDEHVLEQLGCCTRERTRGPGIPTLIATGIPQLLAHLVDGVVLRVVDRDLRRERRHAHEAK